MKCTFKTIKCTLFSREEKNEFLGLSQYPHSWSWPLESVCMSQEVSAQDYPRSEKCQSSVPLMHHKSTLSLISLQSSIWGISHHSSCSGTCNGVENFRKLSRKFENFRNIGFQTFNRTCPPLCNPIIKSHKKGKEKCTTL